MMFPECPKGKLPSEITGANAGGPRQLPMPMRWAARVAQFWRLLVGRRIAFMTIDYRNITVEIAQKAIQAYNSGCYGGGIKNPDLDRKALALFANGLGRTLEEVHRQVRFIGVDYGGAAGFPAAYLLAPAIARDIYDVRSRYARLATGALPLSVAPCSLEVVSQLYAPFIKPLYGKSNWHVWATKFWHFLRPEAFAIEDSRVDKFFRTGARASSPAKYVFFLRRFRQFTITHSSWVPRLREVDGELAWSENKLWDKVCYGLRELQDRCTS
jgi:hypothetical protein